MEPATDVGVSVATEAATWSLAKVIKHIGYLYKYKQNLESLKVAAKQLNAKSKDASRFAQDTNRKQKDVSNTIADWGPGADQLYQNAQDIVSTNTISCLHPWSRYSTSKHALEKAKEINEMVQAAPEFGTTFDRQPHKLGDKFDLKDFMEFKSRASVVDDIWEAIKNEKVRMCSICGMGGTGKTTLVKKLIQRVQTDHLFDMVAIATVSQNPDLTKIRRGIVSTLGWEFKSGELETPDKLNDCLMNNDDGSILLILDDVWAKLDFEEIGLPKEKLKIVLTSRSIAVCETMGSQPNFIIKVLTDEEAWLLFKELTIESIEKFKLHDTARKIADECGGLPMVIVPLAAALKHEDEATWNDSLVKLKRSNLLDIPEMEKVYLRIHLSYDLLIDQEVKACFRLCSLFPEDENVQVEFLMLFAKGLQVFKNVESMSETRDRVASIISKLKKSFLLLDGDEDGTVKMHDILRDFAISISSKEYMVGCEKVMEKWPEISQYKDCSAISFVCDKINEQTLDLTCPNLELLHLFLEDDQVRLQMGSFEELKELKVLFLKIPSLLQSLTMLKKLRTLVIDETSNDWTASAAKIGDLLGHGDLENLEILAFATTRPCYDFPVEIGLLCNLRCLYFRDVKFNYMPPGVLSKLVRLEELELPPTFDTWGCTIRRRGGGGERVNASLDEIESLPLTTLEINVSRHSVLSEKLVKNLINFRICVENRKRLYTTPKTLNVAHVDARDLKASWISCLLRKCESFRLAFVSNLENLTWLQADEGNGFPQWKDIRIFKCNEMECLVNTIAERSPSTFFCELNSLRMSNMDSLKEIWRGPYFSTQNSEVPSFSNLSEIVICECPKLKHVFPPSVAKELRQLQTLEIIDCQEIEEIFYRDQVHAGNQVLSSVHLSTPTVATTSTPTPLVPSTNEKPKLMCPTPNSFIRCLCGREKHPKMVPDQQINMEENVAKVEETEVDDVIIFPQLKHLILGSLGNLRILYNGNHPIELPSLEVFTIDQCNNMEGLSYGSFIAPWLEYIKINWTNYGAARVDLNAVVKNIMLNHQRRGTRYEIVEE